MSEQEQEALEPELAGDPLLAAPLEESESEEQTQQDEVIVLKRS